MAELPRTLHAALVLSPVAHGRLNSIDATKALALDGVVRVLSAKDVPGHNEVAPILAGEPLFATNHVEHVGQIVAAVAAEDFETA
ncbi:MAG: xanthine dehydrogenase molybdopterin binding subunit, partial [Hyphomicrobiales bacterium]|nr:xanthine dehydrogenase molybdopterin binding subunit [Hyphomicrobiales bacterium]